MRGHVAHEASMDLFIGNGIVLHPRSWLCFGIIIIVKIKEKKFESEHGPKEGKANTEL